MKPIEQPRGRGIWGGDAGQVEYAAHVSHPASQEALSSIWMKNSLYNTEKKLNSLQVRLMLVYTTHVS